MLKARIQAVKYDIKQSKYSFGKKGGGGWFVYLQYTRQTPEYPLVSSLGCVVSLEPNFDLTSTRKINIYL